jgi:N6-adenosine-specific RNA methylase IME4
MSEPRELVILTKAERMLAEATTLDEVKHILDTAEVARVYSKKIGLCHDITIHAAAIKVNAVRKLGQLLKATELAKGAPGNQYTGKAEVNQSQDATGPIRLRDIGVSKSDSSRAQTIASLPAPTFARYVSECIESRQEPTTAGLLRLAKQHRANGSVQTHSEHPDRFVTSLQTLINAGRKFRTITCDPPWAFRDEATRAAASNHYPTMSVEQIAAEPVAQVAADSCFLHLWCPSAFLPQAFEVIAAWGFSYSSSSFCWVKPQMGMGNYWRMAHEYCLLSRMGNPAFLDHGQRSWLEAERTSHSTKPEQFRSIIEKVSPGPYLEMYGRVLPENPAWTVFGNQLKTTKG